MTTFFDVFWTGLPDRTTDPNPQPETAVATPLTPPRMRLPDLPTPRDAGLTEPVRLVRQVEARMRQEGLLDDEDLGPRRRLWPANDGWVRRCA